VCIESKLSDDQRKTFQKKFKVSVYVPSKKWNYENVTATLQNGVLNLTFEAKTPVTFPQITIQ
jgi:HSP20 family molecular chaperone IbpA